MVFVVYVCRRQEAQRLGRILRKKKGLPGAPTEEFDAFFYTLVSTDTQEVYFTTKRQQFLIDQGYAYKVIPSLLDVAGAEAGSLLMSSQEDQLNLLTAVMSYNDNEAEQLADVEAAEVKDDLEGRKYVLLPSLWLTILYCYLLICLERHY